VLAPTSYYARYDLGPLTAVLNQGCVALGRAHDVTWSFGFEVLDERLLRPAALDPETLLAHLRHRPTPA
jgi:hypothetical protein